MRPRRWPGVTFQGGPTTRRPVCPRVNRSALWHGAGRRRPRHWPRRFGRTVGKGATERGSVSSPLSRPLGRALGSRGQRPRAPAGQRASLPTSGRRLLARRSSKSGGASHSRSPDGHGGLQPRQLRLQRPSTEPRRLPVLAPFVRVGLGWVGGADQIRLTETPKCPIEGGDFKSRSATGTRLGLLKDRVAVTRPIHDTQQDVEFDTSKRNVLIGSSHERASDEVDEWILASR